MWPNCSKNLIVELHFDFLFLVLQKELPSVIRNIFYFRMVRNCFPAILLVSISQGFFFVCVWPVLVYPSFLFILPLLLLTKFVEDRHYILGALLHASFYIGSFYFLIIYLKVNILYKLLFVIVAIQHYN